MDLQEACFLLYFFETTHEGLYMIDLLNEMINYGYDIPWLWDIDSAVPLTDARFLSCEGV